MTKSDERNPEAAALRNRLTKLSEASLRINESLEFDAVLKEAVDSARSLTGARYGMTTLLDDEGRVQDCITSGLTPFQSKRMWFRPERDTLFEHFSVITEPLRLRDLHSHIRSEGLPEFRPQIPLSPSPALLAAPIRYRGQSVGTFYLCEKDGGEAFTAEDEETLVMFASQAALVIANARRYRDEQRARLDLEALIDTSPVGVAVLDARSGAALSWNREARRIVDDLCTPGEPEEKLLGGVDGPARRWSRDIAAGTPHRAGAELRRDNSCRGDRPRFTRRPVRDGAGQCHTHSSRGWGD